MLWVSERRRGRPPAAQGAAGLWGGLKGWTADRLGRGSRDGGDSSYDEDDEEVPLDESLHAADASGAP